jgi:hypothetical protein
MAAPEQRPGPWPYVAILGAVLIFANAFPAVKICIGARHRPDLPAPEQPHSARDAGWAESAPVSLPLDGRAHDRVASELASGDNALGQVGADLQGFRPTRLRHDHTREVMKWLHGRRREFPSPGDCRQRHTSLANQITNQTDDSPVGVGEDQVEELVGRVSGVAGGWAIASKRDVTPERPLLAGQVVGLWLWCRS